MGTIVMHYFTVHTLVPFIACFLLPHVMAFTCRRKISNIYSPASLVYLIYIFFFHYLFFHLYIFILRCNNKLINFTLCSIIIYFLPSCQSQLFFLNLSSNRFFLILNFLTKKIPLKIFLLKIKFLLQLKKT